MKVVVESRRIMDHFQTRISVVTYYHPTNHTNTVQCAS